MPNMAEYMNPYPRPMYHATELPKLVKTEEEEKALGEGWSADYIYQAYPKIMFGPNGETKNAANPEEEAALAGEGWTDVAPVIPDVPPVTLNPTSASLPATAGTGTFTVTITGTGLSNTWTVVPDAAATWLSITSPTAPQSVNGPVSYSVTENTDVARTAGVYVNGKTFTIDQEGTGAATMSRSRKNH